MRQTYEVIGGPAVGRASLPLLRQTLKSMELDGVYIPHDDEYQNEYLPACYERLAWATGFTGSAGAAFVFQKSAIVFVDGRYTLQVKNQLPPKMFEVADLVAIEERLEAAGLQVEGRVQPAAVAEGVAGAEEEQGGGGHLGLRAQAHGSRFTVQEDREPRVGGHGVGWTFLPL